MFDALGVDDEGRPIFLTSTMAMNTENLQAYSRASLFVTDPGTNGAPLGSSSDIDRKCHPSSRGRLAAARTVYLAGYPDSDY